MSLSHRIAQHPALTSALTRWADPHSFTDAGELRRAIKALDLDVPPDFLTARMVGMVMRISGVQPVHTRKGTLYLGIRPH